MNILIEILSFIIGWILGVITRDGVRIDIWTHFMRGCIIDYVH